MIRRGRKGQSATEFIIFLSFFTFVGYLFVRLVLGGSGTTGAAESISITGTQKIANDTN